MGQGSKATRLDLEELWNAARQTLERSESTLAALYLRGLFGTDWTTCTNPTTGAPYTAWEASAKFYEVPEEAKKAARTRPRSRARYGKRRRGNT